MEPNRLAQYGTIDRNAIAERLDDIADREVTILGFRVAEGDFGEYAFVDITDESGEKHTVMTGASFVLDALKDAQAKKAFPLNARFTKKGRTWVFE